MTNVETTTASIPVVGEEIEVGRPVVKGVIERVLPGGTLAIRNGDDVLFAKAAGHGYYEETPEPWDNPEYEDMRRIELMPAVGEKVKLTVTTYIGCDGDGGGWGELVLQGTVKAVDEQDRCNIQIAPFEVVADRDYWINRQKHDSVDDNLGLIQNRRRIN